MNQNKKTIKKLIPLKLGKMRELINPCHNFVYMLHFPREKEENDTQVKTDCFECTHATYLTGTAVRPFSIFNRLNGKILLVTSSGL